MHPLLIPVGLLLLSNFQRGSARAAAPQAAPKPTPPPGATVLRRAPAPKALKAQPLRGDPYAPRPAAPPPRPALTIEHPDVTPAAQAPLQAAVDAAVSQAIREDLPPASPPASTSGRSPKQAAIDLMQFLVKTGRFGSNSKTDRPAEVKAAQRDLGLKADGIVGPKTRAAAAKHGVALPPVK